MKLPHILRWFCRNLSLFIAILIILLSNKNGICGDDNGNGQIDLGESITWNIPYLSQMDYCVDYCACGPTSLAMVLEYYYEHNSENIDGETIYKNGVMGGNNTDRLLNSYEFHATCGVSASSCYSKGTTFGYIAALAKYVKLNQTIHDGNSIIGLDCSVKSGSGVTESEFESNLKKWIINGPIVISTKLISGGHFVVIKGITETGMFVVNDPYGNPRKSNYYNCNHLSGENIELEYGKDYTILNGAPGGSIFLVGSGAIVFSCSEELKEILKDVYIIEDDVRHSSFDISGMSNCWYYYLLSSSTPMGFHYIKSNSAPTVTALWKPNLYADGYYDVYIGVYLYSTNSEVVNYYIKDGYGQIHNIKKSQYSQANGFKDIYLGRYFFSKDDGCYVSVTDESNTDNIGRDVNIDTAKFVYANNLKKKNWFFNNENLEGWSLNGFEQQQFTGEGWLQLTPSTDPQMVSPYLSIPPSHIDFIQFYGRNNSQDFSGQMYIKTDLNPTYNETNQIDFTFFSDNRWHLTQINTHDIPGWDEANKITGIRIDPVQSGDGANDELFIDFIRLRKKPPNAADPSVKWHPDGALLKSASNSIDYPPDTYFLLERGVKKRITDGDTFEAYNFDWCNVITVSDEELNCYPTGSDLATASERLIKRQGTDAYGNPYPKVYQVHGSDGKRWIRNEDVFLKLGYEWNEVEDVSESELNSYPDGPDVTSIYPEGTLVKAPDSSGIYMISNGEARAFSSQEAFEKLGYYGQYAVQMTWPLGGETLAAGTNRDVTYTIGNSTPVSLVTITSTTDKFKTDSVITMDAPVNSHFTWHVPDIATDGASVKVTAYDSDGRPYFDTPETYITIEPNPNPGQDYFDIYNDGGVELTVSHIDLENSSPWIEFPNLPSLPFAVSPNSSVRIPVSVNKFGLAPGMHMDIIHVVSDDPDNPDTTIDVQLDIKSENDAPDAPVSLIANPSGWSTSQVYTIDWTNPADPSGIAGGYYKVGSPPANDTDGTYFDIAEKPLQIQVLSGGNFDAYLWLKDCAGNVDHTHNDSVTLLHDSTPPVIQRTTPSENAVEVPIDASIACLVADQLSGINTSNISMSVKGVPVTPQQITSAGEGVWFEYQPGTNFAFNEDVTVNFQISDQSNPANQVEKTFSFHTFSANGDTDNDGLLNSDEYATGTDPLNSDSDFDGMSDGWEVDQGLNPTSGTGDDGPDGDFNGDGLTNIQEYLNGSYYSADPADIIDAPTGTVTTNSATVHIGGSGVVAFKYHLNDGTWQAEMSVDSPIELVGLANGSHTLYVIGADENGYWQGHASASIASWTVQAAPERYTLSNNYIYLSGIDGYFDQLKVDPTGSGNYGQNIINSTGKLDWKIDGGTFSNSNTIIQLQETDRMVLNNQAGALWDIHISNGQFTSSLNLAYSPSYVQIYLDTPYEDSGYYDYPTRYHWEFDNNHDASNIPFKTFYTETGNTRTIEYFMRNNDTGPYTQFRTNLFDDTTQAPTTGNNRLIAIGTGNFDIDFNNLPSFQIWVEKTGDTFTLCSGQNTNAQTVNFDFEVTQLNENEDIDANENGDKMPYFYTSANEIIANAYGGEYTFDELLNRFYRQSAFYYTDVGLNIWWNWASQYTGFVNSWYRNKLKANLETWEQGDDGYGHSGYMWSWPGNREWPMGDLYLTYDFRFLNTNSLFIQSVWNYYSWTGDSTFLSGQLQRLRDAMQYQLDWLGGSSEHLINGDNAYDPDHGGINNEDVGTNYWDIMPFGGKDAYCSIDFYKSLEAMAQIEYALGNTVENDGYTTMAEQAKTAYNNTFWSTTTNRYIGAIDRLDNVHDYGFSFVNIEALAAGLGDSTKAGQIYGWLDSGDIYSEWEFAPRTNTTTTQNLWRIPNNNGYVWEQQLQDGGANLYVSGYDVIARAKYVDADDAYARLKAILERYSEPDKLTGGSPTIFNETIQGGSDGAGSLGVMSHEFPESGVAGAAFLYAFIGLEPKADGLHINPKLPISQDYIGAKNINYRGMNLNFHITDTIIQIECTKNENIGNSYYVIGGQQKQFPNGVFSPINEPYGEQFTCEGDFNGDNDVDGSDLATFAADFGRTDCSGDCEGDFDGDGDVDGSDLAVFAADFGRTDCP